MRLHRRFADAQALGRLGHAPHLDHGEQHPQLGAGESIELADHLRPAVGLDRRLVDEYGGERGTASVAAVAGGERHDVGDVVVAVAGAERHCRGAALGVGGLGHGLLERRCGAALAGGEAAVGRAQHGPLLQHGVAAGVGMHDAACRIDDEQAGAQAIKGIGERGSFGCIHHLRSLHIGVYGECHWSNEAR